MLQSWVDVEEIKRFLPSRQFFEKHARTIAIGVAALALWAAFPILTIPVFGVALPLGAGWLLLRSMIEDQRLAAKRARRSGYCAKRSLGRLRESAPRRPRIARHVQRRLRQRGRNTGLIAPNLGCGGQI